jgi:hypothetical protein
VALSHHKAGVARDHAKSSLKHHDIGCLKRLAVHLSLRGAERRSNPALQIKNGLLRFARNDEIPTRPQVR